MSEERIDHALHAERLLTRTRGNVSGEPMPTTEDVNRATAFALIALVEQQIIANLIALATGVDVIGGAGIARMASNEAHRHLASDPNGELRPEIRHALGIA